MEAMRDRWTDDRMDDLNGKVDLLRGEMKSEFTDVRREMRTEFAAVRDEMKSEFAAVRNDMKAEFAAVRGEMKAEFTAVRDEMKAESARTEERFEAMMDRLLSMQRQMLQFSAVAIAALAGVIAALVAVAIKL